MKPPLFPWNTESIDTRDLPKGTIITVKTRSDILTIWLAHPYYGDTTVWSKKRLPTGKNLRFKGSQFSPAGAGLCKLGVIREGMFLEFIDPSKKISGHGLVNIDDYRRVGYFGATVSFEVKLPSQTFDQNPNAQPMRRKKWG